MIYQVAPILCSTFKGILPSDLVERYDGPLGRWKLELDVAVAGEIADQLNESAQSSKKGANRNKARGAVARRKQRRKLYSGAETSDSLKSMMEGD